MMRVSIRAVLLASVALPLAAQAAGKPAIPAMLERAHYVAFGYDLGDGVVSTNQISAVAGGTLTEERRVLDAIRRDVEKWGRYVVADRPEDADILIVVRMSRPASMEMGTGTVGGSDAFGRSRGETGGGRTVSTRAIGGQVSSGGDRLVVYESVHGRPGTELWSAAESDGLAGSPPRLYKSFRDEVTAATKKP
jgi:hypothetical protein